MIVRAQFDSLCVMFRMSNHLSQTDLTVLFLGHLSVGLRVSSPHGLLIRHLRRYVMYCNACFHVHRKESDLTRIFCAHCGANHLSRVNATLSDDGQLHLHLKKGYTLSARGTKYSMPAPGSQPRFQGEVLLRQDQLMSGIWQQRALRVKKEVASAFGEEVATEMGVHVNKVRDTSATAWKISSLVVVVCCHCDGWTCFLLLLFCFVNDFGVIFLSLFALLLVHANVMLTWLHTGLQDRFRFGQEEQSERAERTRTSRQIAHQQ